RAGRSVELTGFRDRAVAMLRTRVRFHIGGLGVGFVRRVRRVRGRARARARDLASARARRLLPLLVGPLRATWIRDLVDDDLLALVEHGVVRDPVDAREVVRPEPELLRDIRKFLLALRDVLGAHAALARLGDVA